MEGEFRFMFCIPSLKLSRIKLNSGSQVISSIEQKTEGSEKKQQLAKEYREKVNISFKRHRQLETFRTFIQTLEL